MRRRVGSFLLALSIALVPAAAACSEGSEVSRISDDRIKESSGLAISSEHQDLAYTVNDAGNAPVVYGIRISTGEVIGTTRIGGGAVKDSESIAIDGDGTMWVSDLGDNDAERGDVALYAFPEPGPGDHSVEAKRYAVTYDGGAVDIEAFLVHPDTGAKFLVSKEKKKGGTLYALPDELAADRANQASDLGEQMPEDVSDGTFTSDGSQVLIRTRESVYVFDPESWQEVEQLSVPEVEQGESIAMEPDGKSFIIGSEGKDSPLIRVPFGPDAAEESAAPTPAEEDTREGAQSDEGEESNGVNIPIYLVVAVVAVGILGLVAVWVARRRQDL
ncbi:MAG: hypothetical protein ACR2FE_00640 [Aeromicrobium sp.]